MSEPVDFVARRRIALRARVDRARRQLAEAEADARADAESAAELRAFASREDLDPGQTKAAADFAHQIERSAAGMLATARAECAAAQAKWSANLRAEGANTKV